MDQSNYKNVLNLAENEEHKKSANHLKWVISKRKHVDPISDDQRFEIVVYDARWVCDIIIADKLIAKHA
jgi:hypothetical protein